MRFDNSIMLFERTKKVVPSCTQTFSKGWTQYPFGAAPIFLERADGCWVWDVDGNRYIDLPMALGPVVLGHNYPPVVEAVKEQLYHGIAFSLPHRKELALSEKLVEIIPCAEMVRLGKNGSDATSGAVRACRAYTGRERVACCGYHGWQDWYIGLTTRGRGVPEAVKGLVSPFCYNDIPSLERLFGMHPGEIACVILEPTGVTPPLAGFLEQVVEVSHKNGALVVFDECWTGFRMAMGGAQEYFGVTPDLACLGKAMGNGFPISAVVGVKDVMEVFDEIFFSFTFGGDLIGITAALAVISEMEQGGVLPHIWREGARLAEGIKGLIGFHGLERHVSICGYPPRTVMDFKDDEGNPWLELKSLIQQEMIKRGVLYSGYHVMTYSHTEREIDTVLTAFDQTFGAVKGAVDDGRVRDMLEGETVRPVFRKP